MISWRTRFGKEKGENMEYLVPQGGYVTELDPMNFSQFDESRIPFNIENNSGQGNIIEEIQRDKKEFLEETIKGIKEQIEQRKNLNENNTWNIDKEMCKFETKLCELLDFYKFNNKNVEKAKLEFELKLADLDKEKRDEQVLCFRDVSVLKKDLRFFVQELRKIIQKEKILSNS